MESVLNSLGQPIGLPLPQWAPPPLPPRQTLAGRFCRVEPLQPERHATELYATQRLDPQGRNWTYLAYGPFERFEDYQGWLMSMAQASDPLFFAIVDAATSQAVGVCSYLRIDPQQGSIEVGHLNFSPLLQRRPAATEAMYLMMSQAFELGYRRYEWKCDALNAPSCRAAERLGFSYEGLFRQATVYKGRNRDTAWYAVIDGEWPRLQMTFESWLDPGNFDDNGHQKSSLATLRSSIPTQK